MAFPITAVSEDSVGTFELLQQGLHAHSGLRLHVTGQAARTASSSTLTLPLTSPVIVAGLLLSFASPSLRA